MLAFVVQKFRQHRLTRGVQVLLPAGVLKAQTSLAGAEGSLVQAITEHPISQVDLAFATGMTLGQSRVA